MLIQLQRLPQQGRLPLHQDTPFNTIHQLFTALGSVLFACYLEDRNHQGLASPVTKLYLVYRWCSQETQMISMMATGLRAFLEQQ